MNTPPTASLTHLGTALRRAREASGISQDAVGSACGLARGTISDVESGRRALRDERLVMIERYVGCEAGLLVHAAARDRGGITIPTGLDGDGDEVTVLYALRVRSLSPHARAAIRRALMAG